MIDVRIVNEATPEIAENIGQIMPFLSSSHDGSPLDMDYLRNTVESPSAVQLVAVINEHEDPEVWDLAQRHPIVGAATISTLHGALGEKAWLEDFVAVPEARKYRVGQALWDAMTSWRTENGLYQMRFNSRADRNSAHSFYHRNGCIELASGETTLFSHTIEVNTED